MKEIIVVSGLPGVGKSTLAEGLAQRLQIPIFSVDPIESAILKSGIERSFETGLAAYEVAETLAGEQLKLGLSAVIDAVSPVKESRQMWHNLSDKYQARLRVIECILDEKIHQQRVKARVRNLHGIPEVTWVDVEKRKQEYLQWDEERLIIDTSDNQAANIKKALQFLSS